jgi:hypothetical protein
MEKLSTGFAGTNILKLFETMVDVVGLEPVGSGSRQAVILRSKTDSSAACHQ